MSYSRDFTRLLQLLLILFVVLLSHSRDINAGLTSTYVRPQWASTDMPLDNPAFAIPKGYNAPEQVHITQGDYEGKAIIVSWVTPAETGFSEVFYGTTEHNYDNSAEGSVTQYTFYNYTSGFIHHCLIDGLEYNKKYYYKIGNGSSAREFWFFTPPKIDPDAAYKFGIIGDLGQTFHSLSTFEHYLKNPGQAVLYVGDLSYADDYEFDNGVRWDTWGRFVEPSTAHQPWIWTSGNHEIEFREDLGENVPFKPFLHRYHVPHKASSSTSPLWYAIKQASAHIIILSSYSPFGLNGPQDAGLTNRLQQLNAQTPD